MLVSLAKGLLISFFFQKNHAYILIFKIAFLFFIFFMSALTFIISFLPLNLGLVYFLHSLMVVNFSGYLRS